MPSKRNKQRSFRRQLAVPVLSDIEEDASTTSSTPQPENETSQTEMTHQQGQDDTGFDVLEHEQHSDDIDLEFRVHSVENHDDIHFAEEHHFDEDDNPQISHYSDYDPVNDHLRDYGNDDDDIELEDSPFNGSEISELFQDYRHECQRLLSRPDSDKNQKYVMELEKTVQELLEQNEVLVDNLHTVTIESGMRVKELRNRLRNSAQRTEETMLALSSHELYLKSFSEKHCCACCACDTRLLATRLCHGGLCEFDSPNTDPINNKPCSMDSARAGYYRSVHNTDQWYSTVRPRAVDAHRLECIQNLPSQVRFSSLVDRLQRQSNSLEQENRDLKHENALIRQLNSYLSGRDLSVTMPSRVLDQNRNPMSIHVNKFHHEDYEEYIRHSSSVASFSPPVSDSCDSCPISRPESLAEGRADNDSGCSTTDLIPSTTDIASLLMSDCDEDCLSDPPEMTKLSGAQSGHNAHHHHSSQHTGGHNKRLSHAERLVPKLFQQLLYYAAQRNLLVKQFKNETDARQQCKNDIASLADCLAFELGTMEQQQQQPTTMTTTTTPSQQQPAVVEAEITQ